MLPILLIGNTHQRGFTIMGTVLLDYVVHPDLAVFREIFGEVFAKSSSLPLKISGHFQDFTRFYPNYTDARLSVDLADHTVELNSVVSVTKFQLALIPLLADKISAMYIPLTTFPLIYLLLIIIYTELCYLQSF